MREVHEAANAEHFQRLRHDGDPSGTHFCVPFDLPDNAGSAGRSCTDDEVRIVKLREDGSHSEPDEPGPARQRGRGRDHHLLPGKERISATINNPEMTEQKFYKGFLYTGDVGTWDENEFVTVSRPQATT